MTLLALTLSGAAERVDGAGAAGAGAAGTGAAGASWFPSRIVHAPLDTPLVVNGGFGEFRKGHFHAGLDFGTGQRVGRPVYAPLGGWIERVRASGVGYGRSVYLHSEDGRLLVFGHLDAFEQPLAGYVAAKQDSSGQYEQDLWPEPRQFPIRAGQLIAWSGQSGSGGPHLHFEIRRGDMAYNPLRAGLWLPGTRMPGLPAVTLEPLDDTSRVEGGLAPLTLALRPAPDTVEVIGRVRAIVDAREGAWRGVDRMVPWAVRTEWDGGAIECRFDSVSWATDMAEADYVYDTGRVRGEKGLVLWAPQRFRPRVIMAAAPESAEAGTIRIARGAQPVTLRIIATDLGGNSVTREVVLKAEPRGTPVPSPDTDASDDRSAGMEAPGTIREAGRDTSPSTEGRYAALPGRRLRVSLRGLSAGRGEELWIGKSRGPLTFRRGEATAIVAMDALPVSARLAVRRAGRPGRTVMAPGTSGPLLRFSPAEEGRGDGVGALSWTIPGGALFEPAIFVAGVQREVRAAKELVPLGEAYVLHPVEHPLRGPLRFRFRLADGESPERVGFFQDRGEDWEFVRARYDTAGRFFEGESRGLGRFALFRDLEAPRIARLRAPRRRGAGPYSRWALESRLDERGSGVDARATFFVVDGRRVPSEWDAEERILRWRPLSPPASGGHRCEVIATDRAGNAARATGTFVLD